MQGVPATPGRVGPTTCASPSWARGSWARPWPATWPPRAIEVRAWNRSRERAEPLAADGVEVADSRRGGGPRGGRRRDDALRRRRAVEAVVGDLEFPGGAVWAQMSTVGIEATDRLVARAAEAGVPIVDAPVLGTKAPAEQGKLTVIAAGPAGRASAARRCSTPSAPAPSRSATSPAPPRG